MKTNYFKRTLCMALILSLVAIAFACTKPSDDQNRGNNIKISALKGPTAMGLAKLWHDSATGNTQNDYHFAMETTMDAMTASLLNNSIDAAVIPSNIAAVLVNRSGLNLKVAAISVLGVLEVVTTDESITDINDLRGKSIIMTGANTVTQYTLEHLLSKNQIPSNEVTVQYYAETAEALARVLNGSATTAILPQPFVTSALRQASANGITLHKAFKLNDEWEKFEDAPPITAVLVVRENYLQYNKSVFDAFLEDYRESVQFMIDPQNLDAAASLIVERDIIPQLPIAKEALPECAITFIEGEDMQAQLAYFYEILHGQNSDSVGGKLPLETFYYKR